MARRERGDACVTREECAGHHGRVLEKLGEIEALARDTNRRLFVDNGTPSIQTRVNRHELVIRALLWVVSVAAASGIAAAVAACVALARLLVKLGG